MNIQFALGPAGSGAVMHFHQPAINFLAFGRKRWSLLRPKDALYSDIPARTWVHQYVDGHQADGRNDRLREQHLQCTQNAGDVLILPLYWGHSTLNVEASIGFAFELAFEPSTTVLSEDAMSALWTKVSRG